MNKVKLVTLKDVKFNKDLFVPMKTGTKVDEMFSSDGGLMPATNTILTGDPGAGKTTVLLDILGDLQAKGKKVLFVSAEMNQIDMHGYVKRFPKFGKIPTLFLGDYGEFPKQAVESVLNEGWDAVVMDSWAEISEQLKGASSSYMSETKADSIILSWLEEHNNGNNKAKKNTAFLVVQQITKGGKFTGSNRLKHMTTAMGHIEFKNEIRSLYFSKNRRGGRMDKLNFHLSASNKVGYTGFTSMNEE